MAEMTPDRADVMVIQRMVDTMVGREKFSYPARQNGVGLDQPKPKGEFAHIRVIEEYPESIPAGSIKAQDELTTTYIYRTLTRIRARIGVVETNGLASTKILTGWTSEVMKALMIETGYGFIKCTPLSSEDSKLEKEWEYRKGFSVDFYVTREYEEVVNNITHLQISGKFIAPEEEVLLDFEINL